MDEQQNNNIIISFDNVKMKDFFAYWDAVKAADWRGQHQFFAKVVKNWAYNLDVADAESYGELRLEEYAAVQTAVSQAAKAFIANQQVNVKKRRKGKG